MNDMYKELMVVPPQKLSGRILQIALMMLAIVSAVFAFLSLNMLFLLVAFALGAASWWAGMNAVIEYEYLYVNGDIDVDRIINRQRRKKAAAFAITELEMLAPVNSHDLDTFRNNKSVRIADYTSDPKGSNVYGAVYFQEKGKVMALLELDADIISDMRRHQPRKISRDCMVR